MKKILFIIINYNSEDDTIRYLKSIQNSQEATSNIILDIILVDNSTMKSPRLKHEISPISLNIQLINSDNVGYFGAFKRALEMVGYPHVATYAHVIVSNVDLELSEDFFESLNNCRVDEETGVLAPSIVSNYRNNDLNPKILHKPQKSKILINYLLFNYPLLFAFYTNLSYVKLKHTKAYQNEIDIYAPHGSFIIFNQIFFQKGGTIDYPVFLFGEEIYVAETVKQKGLKIVYTPQLKVYDYDHGSTSKEKRSFISGKHRKALKYILENFY